MAWHVNSCISKSSFQVSPILPTRPKGLLAVGECKRSGLIVCKQYYAEFIGPGAAICLSSEADFVRIIAIGAPEIIEVTTYEERQKAYSRKIQWVRWLNRIVAEPQPHHRAEKLFAGFEEFFGSEILCKIPDDVLAVLAGVLPSTIRGLRSQQQYIERTGGVNHYLSDDQLDSSVVTLDCQNSSDLKVACLLPVASSPLVGINALPCSA